MPNAMTLISAQVLGSTSTLITWNAIPQTYRDLMIVFTGSGTAADNIFITFNNDASTGTNYLLVNMRGTGSATGSSSGGSNIATTLDTVIHTSTFNVLDYSATDKHKTALNRGSSSSNWVMASAIRWANTAAVTRLDLSSGSTTFTAGSTFYLYGIAG